jgi:phage gpG-like protein
LKRCISCDGLHFGSDREYAAAQNFGTLKQNLPARQWLGLSSDDDEATEDIAKQHLQMAAGLE